MQPTRALLRSRFRKLRLTTKDVNKGFYKGTRTGTVGRHTKYGGFIIDFSRVRTYVCPSLENFKVRRGGARRTASPCACLPWLGILVRVMEIVD